MDRLPANFDYRRIVAMPRAGSLIKRLPPDSLVRRRAVTRFPCHGVYLEMASHIHMHLSPAALKAAIRLLESHTGPAKAGHYAGLKPDTALIVETFWRRGRSIGRRFELEEVKWGG